MKRKIKGGFQNIYEDGKLYAEENKGDPYKLNNCLMCHGKTNNAICTPCLSHVRMRDKRLSKPTTIYIKKLGYEVEEKLIEDFDSYEKDVITMNVVKTVHYCKANKKEGKPVVVRDAIKKTEKNVKKWQMNLFDENGKPVRIEVEYNNSPKVVRRRGATTVLKVLKYPD